MENKAKIHVVHLLANHPHVPYLNWFAEGVHKYPDVRFTMVNLYPTRSQMLDDMEERGCDCYWIKYDKRFRRVWMLYAFFKLCILFIKIKPDVVCTHLFEDSFIGLLAARLMRIKRRVIRKQDTAYRWYFEPSRVWGDKVNNRNATDIIAISEESKKFLIEKEKADEKKIRLIHNGIPIQQFTAQDEKVKQNFREQYKLNGKIVVGTVARYIEWKGYRYIIEAAKTLVKKYPDLSFLFAGYGYQQQYFANMIKENGLEDYITITGFIEPQLMPSFYGIMDICVHVAFMEPFGFVYVEAMANGVAIVTTKTGIAAEILEHKQTCWFTVYKDTQGIIDGITWMLENKEERKLVAERARKMVDEKFSIELMLDRHIKVFKGIAV